MGFDIFCFCSSDPHPSSPLQDEQSAMLMRNRHMILQQAVDHFTESIQNLSDRAQTMFAEDHPDGCVPREKITSKPDVTKMSFPLLLSQLDVVKLDKRSKQLKCDNPCFQITKLILSKPQSNYFALFFSFLSSSLHLIDLCCSSLTL